MTTLLTAPLIGLEQIQRSVFYVLFDNLNNVIGEVEEFMNLSDQEWAAHTGRPESAPTVIERIDDEDFYEGSRPSLIKAPPERYPNVCVIATRATPSSDSGAQDHASIYRDQIYIELMAKSIDSEEEVNRRINRMAEAVHICLMQNPTLNGVISGFDGEPTVVVSEVFTRKERTAYGPEWLWQGARLEYAVRKEAVLPPSSNGSIFRAAQFQYDIDQA